jgi:Lrp/AsnC family transcriptional regulator, leucine-responsive regulatory protein
MQMNTINIDSIDLQLLSSLQRDASLSNLALAEQVHISPPTCLRRVKRLHELKLIEKQVAIVNPDRLAAVLGGGLTAMVEITLDQQNAEIWEQFEARVAQEDRVQQCYRVSPGPDFCLVVHALDMQDYLALTQRLFTADANVRNVKAFFSVKRSKFGAELPLPTAP